jgi:hypothetical protein
MWSGEHARRPEFFADENECLLIEPAARPEEVRVRDARRKLVQLAPEDRQVLFSAEEDTPSEAGDPIVERENGVAVRQQLRHQQGLDARTHEYFLIPDSAGCPL